MSAHTEEGDAVYDIRMAIETLIEAHDGGRLPEPPAPPKFRIVSCQSV